MRDIIIGSRGSKLALWQANFIQRQLADILNVNSSVKIIETSGDRDQRSPFSKMEGIGFFTKELEEALLRREIDIAVHSLKDMTTTLPDGLITAAVGFRADRRELLLMQPEAYDSTAPLFLKQGSTIGTSSARRQAQVTHLDPSLKIKEFRGNVPTRIEKIRKGVCDATILAAAGVSRLSIDFHDLKAMPLDPELFLPAAGQGILALETREDDTGLNTALARLEDETAPMEVTLERGLLKKFNSGCSLPLGVLSSVNQTGQWRLRAVLDVVSETDGSHELRSINIDRGTPNEIVERAYAELTAVKVS